MIAATSFAIALLPSSANDCSATLASYGLIGTVLRVVVCMNQRVVVAVVMAMMDAKT